jgi:hypothetical protein
MVELLPLLFYTLSALVISLLCLPIVLSLHFQREELPTTWHLFLQLAFFRGAVGFGFRFDTRNRFLLPIFLGQAMPFPILTLKGKTQKAKIEREKTQQPTYSNTKTAKERRQSNFLGMLRLLFKPGLQLVKSLPQTVGLKKLQIRGRIGFDDPARTGAVNGYLQVFKLLKNSMIKINVIPDFTRSGAFGQLDIVAHFHFGLLLVLLGRFGLQVTYRFFAVRILRRQPSLI